MKILKSKIFCVVLVTLVGVILTFSDLYALREESKQITELEKIQKEDESPRLERIVRPTIEYKAGNMRDPFKEAETGVEAPSKRPETTGVVAGPPPTLSVQGLIWGGNIPQAIVNNKVVKVGDTIDGAKVVTIEKDGVGIFYNGSEFKVSPSVLSPVSTKKP